VYAHLDNLGVRLDPAIVWNAIPFSFVVDWVVDVSGFLGSFARDNYPINVVVHDFCHSYKWHKEANTHAEYVSDTTLASYSKIPAGYPLKPGWTEVYSGSRRYYNRIPVSNPDIHTARLKAVNLRQAALAGHLLLAKSSFGSSHRYRQAHLSYSERRSRLK
jgi:hypothetical protein